MAPPAEPTEELLEQITRYHVVDPESLWKFVAGRGGAGGLAAEPGDLLADLCREGLLTPFQAEQLLAGAPEELAVGKYLLLNPLGDLDSSVFRARRRPDGSLVALKLLQRGQDVSPRVIERFRREAEALARLDHPRIVGIKEFGEDHGRLYLAMTFIDGISLDELIHRQGPLPPAQAVRIVHQALDALQHIHKSGLVHRNLEPGHLVLDPQGDVHLVDLGLARFLDEPGGNLTLFQGSSQLLGTVAYQSPEQLRNSHEVDIRTDIYAVGAILYFLLSGKVPFSQHALLRLAAGVVTHPQPLAQLRPDLPAELVATVERLMAVNRDQRPATPADAAALLATWLHAVSPPPLQLPRRSSQAGLRPVVLPPAEPPPDPAPSLPTDTPATPDESPLPVWLFTLLLFGATAAAALGVSAWLKLR
ncbi:MAG: serine/threonine-protein kinase [Gemmataceae bacterium]